MASREPPTGSCFRDETAFGPDRHDDGIFHLLGLDQAEDLGAEILRPVGPTQATTGDLAEPQVHAFHPRRIDEDFVERARDRHLLDAAAGKFYRDRGLRLATRVDLIKVGAQRSLDGIDEAAQNPILIETFHVLKRGLDPCANLRFARAALGGRRREARVEAHVKQRNDLGRQACVLAQRPPHVIL